MKVVIGRSRWFLYYLLVLHVLILLITICSELPFIAVITVSGIVGASCVLQLRRFAWLKGGSVPIAIRQIDNNRWAIDYGDGALMSPLTLKQAYVSQWLLIMYFEPNIHRRTVSLVMPVDAIQQEEFRRLSVYLRHPKLWAE